LEDAVVEFENCCHGGATAAEEMDRGGIGATGRGGGTDDGN